LRDVREHPIPFRGYSIGCRRGRDGQRYHASVRISRDRYRALKAEFEHAATRCSAGQLWRALRAIPFSPFAPVRRQLCALLRAVNHRRKAAGLELLPGDALRLRRSPVKPFGAPDPQERSAGLTGLRSNPTDATTQNPSAVPRCAGRG
jgi:hypothetical protein